MVIITTLYLLVVYLIFHKFKLLPWNKASQVICLVIGVIILSAFLVGLQGLTPSSTQAMITGPVTEIAPAVSGQIIEVPAEPNVELDPGTILYRIDPLPYQYRVDQLKAQLADTESGVAQLKESYDAARSQTAATLAQLELTQLRLGQAEALAAKGAGSKFEVEQYQSQDEQLTAQLESAQFDLDNTEIRTPGPGIVTQLVLRPGMQASPSRAIATFVYTDQLILTGLFQQKALQAVQVGDMAKMNFPALPGQVFEGEVMSIPAAIAAYGATVLKAFEEVETSLTNEDLFGQREGFLASAVDSNFKAYELARVQYEVGKIDLLSVLQMQSRWIGARVGLIRIENERLAQRVNLHLALGGSFEVEQ